MILKLVLCLLLDGFATAMQHSNGPPAGVDPFSANWSNSWEQQRALASATPPGSRAQGLPVDESLGLTDSRASDNQQTSNAQSQRPTSNVLTHQSWPNFSDDLPSPTQSHVPKLNSSQHSKSCGKFNNEDQASKETNQTVQDLHRDKKILVEDAPPQTVNQDIQTEHRQIPSEVKSDDNLSTEQENDSLEIVFGSAALIAGSLSIILALGCMTLYLLYSFKLMLVIPVAFALPWSAFLNDYLEYFASHKNSSVHHKVEAIEQSLFYFCCGCIMLFTFNVCCLSIFNRV